jgi:hypothetical protein
VREVFAKGKYRINLGIRDTSVLGDSAVFFCFFLTAGQSLCDKPKIKVVVDLEKKQKNQRYCRNGSVAYTGVNTVCVVGVKTGDYVPNSMPYIPASMVHEMYTYLPVDTCGNHMAGCNKYIVILTLKVK